MGRRKGIKPGVPPFVMMRRDLLNSTAYRELKPSAAKVLPFFVGKVWHAKAAEGNPTGAFQFSYAEAARLGIATRTFCDVISDLVAKGFIDVAVQGGKRGFCHVGSKYVLSERWRQFGSPSFAPARRYPSEEPPTTPARARAKLKEDRPKAVPHG